MLDLKSNQNLKITPKTETIMGEVCQAVRALDTALDGVNFLEPQRTAPHANFHNIEADLPDVTLGELIQWINSFACDEGPNLLRQQPAGAALVKARARQLSEVLKPLMRRVSDIAESPAYRNDQPFLLTALAHPKVCWAFEELCQKMEVLAARG